MLRLRKLTEAELDGPRPPPVPFFQVHDGATDHREFVVLEIFNGRAWVPVPLVDTP